MLVRANTPPLPVTRISEWWSASALTKALMWRLWQKLRAQRVSEKLHTTKDKFKKTINITPLKMCLCLLKSVALRIAELAANYITLVSNLHLPSSWFAIVHMSYTCGG